MQKKKKRTSQQKFTRFLTLFARSLSLRLSEDGDSDDRDDTKGNYLEEKEKGDATREREKELKFKNARQLKRVRSPPSLSPPPSFLAPFFLSPLESKSARRAQRRRPAIPRGAFPEPARPDKPRLCRRRKRATGQHRAAPPPPPPLTAAPRLPKAPPPLPRGQLPAPAPLRPARPGAVQGAEDTQRRAERDRERRGGERGRRGGNGAGGGGRRGSALVVRVAREARPLGQLYFQASDPRDAALAGVRPGPGAPFSRRVPRGGGVEQVQELRGREPAEAEGAGEFFLSSLFCFPFRKTRKSSRR